MNDKIGYIINESSVLMEDFEIIDSNSNKYNKENFKFHNPVHTIGYGRLQTADERNRNGRIYSHDDLEREINAPRQKELLSTGNMQGHAGHPVGPGSESLVVQQTIDPKLCCVRFHKIWMVGNDVMAYFEGTNNDLGETFDKDLKIGVLPAFSLRALGTVRSTPQGALVENMKMITYDYVVYPSHPHAYTQGVLNESCIGGNFIQSNFKLTNSNDATKSNIMTFTNTDVINAIKATNESAIDFVKTSSFNYHMLKECFDLTKIDTVDIINHKQLALTEAGNQTIVMNIEDYISKELQNYKG